MRFNNILFYGTGGLAFGELRAETFGLSESHTNAGWTAGVGAEIRLRAELERQGRISLRRSGQQQLRRSPARRTATASALSAPA